MELKAYLEDRRKMVDRALEEALPEKNGPLAEIVRAMRYSLFAGGKRIRPVLAMAGAEAVGADPESALPAGVALEMIHTYSLIHDDLPAMDDDDMRRGRPSNHKAFGEAAAVLAGDGLLTLAFQILADAGEKPGMDASRILRAVALIARSAGYEGMVGGQAVDMEAQGREADGELVGYLHKCKTAELLTAAVVSGAILGGGGPDDIESLSRYGLSLGLAFQITDDILDIEGDAEAMGKPIGSDESVKKATYPSVFGLEESKKEAGRRVDDAIGALDRFGPEAEPLRQIAEYLRTRKK